MRTDDCHVSSFRPRVNGSESDFISEHDDRSQATTATDERTGEKDSSSPALTTAAKATTAAVENDNNNKGKLRQHVVSAIRLMYNK